MKYLKVFESFEDSPTLRDKLDSIIDMYNYLADKDMLDSLGFIGRCTNIFSSYIIPNKEYPLLSNRPYIFEVDKIEKLLTLSLSSLSKNRKEEKLKEIEEAYKLSKVKRFDKTKKDIEKIIKPFLELEMFGGKVFTKYKIRQYIDGWYKKPCFSVDLEFDEDMLPLYRNEISKIKSNSENPRKDLEEVKSDFDHLDRILDQKLKELEPNLTKNNLKYSISDNSNLHLYHDIILRLTPIN